MIKLALVNNEELFVKLLHGYLNKQPHIQCLFTALNDEEMLKKINQETLPDIILLDLERKKKNSAEITRLLKANYPSLKCIVMSSYYKKSFTGYMMRAGVSAFVPKEISPECLLKVIETVNQQGFYLHEEQVDVLRSQVRSKLPKPTFSNHASFTGREKEVLELLCQQYTAKEIAEKLFVSKRTVEGHKENLFVKTGSRNLVGLVIYAINHQLVNQEALTALP